MREIRIRGAGRATTQPAADAPPRRNPIEVLTSDIRKAFEMLEAFAMEQAAAIVRRLQEEQSLAAEQPPSQTKGQPSCEAR